MLNRAVKGRPKQFFWTRQGFCLATAAATHLIGGPPSCLPGQVEFTATFWTDRETAGCRSGLKNVWKANLLPCDRRALPAARPPAGPGSSWHLLTRTLLDRARHTASGGGSFD